MLKKLIDSLFKYNPLRDMEIELPDPNFVKLVRYCRKRHDSKTIFNASFSHALVLAKNLLDCAKETGEPVRIVSGNLEKDFYEGLTEKIKELQDVEVIVLNPGSKISENSFVQELKKKEAKGESVKVIQASKDMSSKLPHFILVGKNKFRVETDHEHAKALACFNNSEVGGILSQAFIDFKEKLS